MKILHLTSSLAPQFGGTSELVRILSRALSDRACEVTVLSLDRDRETRNLDASVSHVPLDASRGYTKYALSFRLIAWLWRHAREFDVVIAHGIWQFPTLAALLVLRRRGVPFIIYAHGMLTDNSLFRIKSKIPKKLLYWAFVERYALAQAAAVVFTSEWEKSHSARAARASRMHGVVIKNGLPPPPFESRETSQRFASKEACPDPYLLCLGRLDPVKGIDIALRAFAAADAPHFRLIIAGTGEPAHEELLKRLAAELRLGDRIRFAGQVQGPDKWKLLRDAHALLSPSHHENFGIAIVEALSVGCPVLTTRHVGVWEEIERFRAGLLFSTDVGDCAGAIRHLVQLGDEEYPDYRRRALSCFNSEFSIDVTARRLMQLIDSLPGVSHSEAHT